MANPQPPVITAMVDVGQFVCAICGKPGDRIVDCQRFGDEFVGGRKSCQGCAFTPAQAAPACAVEQVADGQ